MTLNLDKPFLIINCKNYLEASGEEARRLAQVSEEVSRENNVDIIICPPIPFTSEICNSVNIPVFTQHVDSDKVGSSTGAIIPEVAKKAGVMGSLVNHSEKRVDPAKISAAVQRLRENGLVSVVCARTPSEVADFAGFSPDFVAIEPPELIGSGVAVSTSKPEVITDSIKAALSTNPKVKVVCGAGIVDGKDVEAAIKLGSSGVLVASGIVKSQDWKRKISAKVKHLIL